MDRTLNRQQALARSVQALLLPVLSFCLRRSLRLREILEIVKTALVRLAQQELEKRGEEASISKIALMTGVHRKDVAALLKVKEPRAGASSIVRKLIGQWRSDSRFLDRSGAPRPLMHVGANSEFAELVRTVSLEMNPYSVLFELERSGAVELHGDSVKIISEEYVPYRKLEEQTGLVAIDVNDLIRAAERNILEASAVPDLHLSTSYDNIALSAMPQIRKWFIKEGARIHRRARSFLSKFDVDMNHRLKGSPSGGRVALGTFSFTESFEEKGTEQAAPKSGRERSGPKR